jgi:F-type H+-transporting ATPase subunit b
MLDISLWLVLFVTVLFLALIYLLNEMLYKPLLAFMDKREASINGDLSASTQNADEIEEAKALAHEKISTAKGEAASIRDAAMAKAKESAAAKLEESKLALEKQYASFIDKLSHDRDALKQQVSANISSYQDGIQAKIKNI